MKYLDLLLKVSRFITIIKWIEVHDQSGNAVDR